MVDLILTEREQSALRTLAAAEPVPGSPFPARKALEALEALVPSDEVVVGRGNDEGFLEATVSLDGRRLSDVDPQVCDGPLMIGLQHLLLIPDEAPRLKRFGQTDCLWFGVRNGAHHVVQIDLSRRSGQYRPRDVAMLRMLSPSLARLMRERPTPQLPATLTVQERRVLMRVAAGHSNRHIAETLSVAESTVRKHLEHSYRKLGVTSRVAAVARLQGRDAPDLDLRERLERFA
jgi:DNA-binding CsgD family transcriptional regulator